METVLLIFKEDNIFLMSKISSSTSILMALWQNSGWTIYENSSQKKNSDQLEPEWGRKQ